MNSRSFGAKSSESSQRFTVHNAYLNDLNKQLFKKTRKPIISVDSKNKKASNLLAFRSFLDFPVFYHGADGRT